MRILGVSQEWPKLRQQAFTTFRYPRADTDWQIGERVQIVLHPRSKDRKVLGMVEIVSKEERELEPGYISVPLVTDEEAIEDGFTDREDMVRWMGKLYGLDYISLLNKLTLRWMEK